MSAQDFRSLGVELILIRLDSAFDAAENYAMAQVEGGGLIKTIIQELIQIPARILRGSGQPKLDIGRALPGREALLALFRRLAAPFPSPA